MKTLQDTKSTWPFQRRDASFFDSAKKTGERRYVIEYKSKEHEVVCPEYGGGSDESCIVMPCYLIPGRRYPSFVYLYAICLYSSNKSMSQRAVAKATREEFGLSKFSHSTVCRAFSALERLANAQVRDSGEGGGIGCAAGESGGAAERGGAEGASAVGTGGAGGAPAANPGDGAKRRFPSRDDTALRRAAMEAFARRAFGYGGCGGFHAAGRRHAIFWHKRRMRL